MTGNSFPKITNMKPYESTVNLIRCMTVMVAVCIMAGMVSAQEPAAVKQLDKVPVLELGKQTWSNGHPQIHRITTAKALKRLGGVKQLAVDFDKMTWLSFVVHLAVPAVRSSI